MKTNTSSLYANSNFNNFQTQNSFLNNFSTIFGPNHVWILVLLASVWNQQLLLWLIFSRMNISAFKIVHKLVCRHITLFNFFIWMNLSWAVWWLVRLLLGLRHFHPHSCRSTENWQQQKIFGRRRNWTKKSFPSWALTARYEVLNFFSVVDQVAKERTVKKDYLNGCFKLGILVIGNTNSS